MRGKLEAIDDQEAGVTDNQSELHEVQTVYSDAFSLSQHSEIDKYISAFAYELYYSLPPEFDAGSLERISSILPSLLEAFAVRLGHEGTEYMQRQLMYLIYRFRR